MVDPALRRRVPPVEHGVEAHPRRTALLRHPQQRVKVRVKRVHAAVGEQADEVQRLPVFLAASMAAQRAGFRKKSPVRTDLEIRTRSWYTTRPAPRFRCPTSEFPIWPAGSPTRSSEAWIRVRGNRRPKPVEERRVGEGDRVPFPRIAMAPAVHDDQRDERAFHPRDYRTLPARRTGPPSRVPPRSGATGCTSRSGRSARRSRS